MLPRVASKVPGAVRTALAAQGRAAAGEAEGESDVAERGAGDAILPVCSSVPLSFARLVRRRAPNRIYAPGLLWKQVDRSQGSRSKLLCTFKGARRSGQETRALLFPLRPRSEESRGQRVRR